MKRILLLAVSLAALIILTGCQGKLPEGMDEESVLSAGEEIVELLTSGDYAGAHALLREDVREQTDVQDVEKLVENVTQKLGKFEKITDSMVTGMADAEIPHAIAVIECKYEKKSVIFRVAIDEDLNFIGLAVKKR